MAGHPEALGAPGTAEGAAVGGGAIGESRWPPALTVLAFMALNIAARVWLPGQGVMHVPWLTPGIEAMLLLVLLSTSPLSPIDHRRLRRVALALVGLLVAAALWATALLVHDLIQGTGEASSASELLASGATVWIGNNLSFALLYWLVDAGGPRARAHDPAPVDLAFTQHLNPGLAPAGWRPAPRT